MTSASLVVGHGGHATTMRALAHGVPLLILPMHRILDQRMIGKAVAAAGAGRVLPKTAPAEEIRSAVQSVLQDPSYRHAARAVGARLRSRNGAIAAADELEGLLRARKGLAEPPPDAPGSALKAHRSAPGPGRQQLRPSAAP
jgi:UDP:flavonoid glycosyltransferase YjiC (YdhE family)